MLLKKVCLLEFVFPMNKSRGMVNMKCIYVTPPKNRLDQCKKSEKELELEIKYDQLQKVMKPESSRG